MSKVKYNRKYGYYERTIKINGVTALLTFPRKDVLEKLPYRLNSKWKGSKKLK